MAPAPKCGLRFDKWIHDAADLMAWGYVKSACMCVVCVRVSVCVWGWVCVFGLNEMLTIKRSQRKSNKRHEKTIKILNKLPCSTSASAAAAYAQYLNWAVRINYARVKGGSSHTRDELRVAVLVQTKPNIKNEKVKR